MAGRTKSAGTRAAIIGVLLLTLGPGCAKIDMDFPYLPPLESLEAIRPGVTTRAEVLRLLGPPEEMRRPAPFVRARQSTPQGRKVLEGRDVFGHDAYTYASAHRNIDVFGLLPVGPSIFRVAWVRSTEQRWRIEFDEDDLVRSVSHVDERADR